MQALPAVLQFVRALGTGESLQGGLAQGVLQFAAILLLRLQLVAQGHQLIDFGDDAGLFDQGRNRYQRIQKSTLIQVRHGGTDGIAQKPLPKAGLLKDQTQILPIALG